MNEEIILEEKNSKKTEVIFHERSMFRILRNEFNKDLDEKTMEGNKIKIAELRQQMEKKNDSIIDTINCVINYVKCNRKH